MGQPKATLPFGNETLLERLVVELRQAFADLIVVASTAADETYPVEELLRRGGSPVTLIRDASPFAGPAGALVAGLRVARHEIVFACSCDLPLMRGDVARMLCTMIGDFDAAIPEVAGQLQPLCAVYARSSADKIEALTHRGGERRLTVITGGLSVRRVSEIELRAIDPDLRSFVNVNTPEDYAHALRLAGLP